MKKIKLIASLMMLVLACTIISCSSSDDDSEKSVTIADNSHYFKIVYEFTNLTEGTGYITASASNSNSKYVDIKINNETNPKSTEIGDIPGSIYKINTNIKTYTIETVSKSVGLSTGIAFQPKTDENYSSEKITYTIKYYMDNKILKTDEGYLYLENSKVYSNNTICGIISSNNGSYQIIAQ